MSLLIILDRRSYIFHHLREQSRESQQKRQAFVDRQRESKPQATATVTSQSTLTSPEGSLLPSFERSRGSPIRASESSTVQTERTVTKDVTYAAVTQGQTGGQPSTPSKATVPDLQVALKTVSSEASEEPDRRQVQRTSVTEDLPICVDSPSDQDPTESYQISGQHESIVGIIP